MSYFKEVFNDKLFLRVVHVIWSVPWFIIAVAMLANFERLMSEPFQFLGVALALGIGGVFLAKGLSNNMRSLKKSRYSPVSDIFFFVFAILSFVPAVVIWETIRFYQNSNK
jgi:ABC-type dipeptide/oligopeptide/nickel transport system permease subunit